MQKKLLIFLIFSIAIAQLLAFGAFKQNFPGNVNITISHDVIVVTFPNRTTKSIPLNVAKNIIQNVSINKTLNILAEKARLNMRIEKVKELYRIYGENDLTIDKEFQEEFIKNLSTSLPANVSYEDQVERVMKREREVWERLERRYLYRIAQREWEKHRICIAIYPPPKECMPVLFPIFDPHTHTIQILLPNGTIITLNATNRTAFIRGLGELRIKNDTEIEIENETSRSMVREIRNRPVIITIVKTKNETHVMVTNLISGVKNEIDVKREGGVFKHFVIHTKENVSNVVVNITRIKNVSLPPQLPELTKRALAHALLYRIHANVSDTKFANITMNLTLNQSWLNQANTTINRILVMRISENGSSMVLPILNVTSEKVGNETFYHLIVVSPGFSYYAIVPLTVSVPSPFEASIIGFFVIAVIIALAVFLLFYLKRKRRKKR
jgi:flagellin-like hook-associated protein FlgL